MSVFVDDMRAPYGRMLMCHMTADSTEELLAMADRIGVARKWLQHEGTDREHFDVCLSKRALAVKAGAIETTARAEARKRIARRAALAGAQKGEPLHDATKHEFDPTCVGCNPKLFEDLKGGEP